MKTTLRRVWIFTFLAREGATQRCLVDESNCLRGTNHALNLKKDEKIRHKTRIKRGERDSSRETPPLLDAKAISFPFFFPIKKLKVTQFYNYH